MFKRLREKLAALAYEKQLTEWQDERDGYEERLQLARTYKGDPSSDVMLKPGEAVFAIVGGAALVEERQGPGHWEGSSSSVSIPIGSLGGRSVRYTAGSSKGHYVQGTSTPTAIDTGIVYVTNQRIIFQGGKQTRECLWSKLIGLQHDDKIGKTAFSVSNRQKPLVIQYGPKASAWFNFRLGLALAHYNETVPALVAQLEGYLADLDARKPQPPAEQAVGDGSQRRGWWRKFRSLPTWVQIVSWIGLAILLIIIGGAAGGENGTGQTASTTTSPPAAAVTSPPTTVTQSSPPTTVPPQPTPTTAPAVTRTPAPATTPPTSTNTPASSPPAAKCYPLTSTGKCYEPGQYCRTADRGASGVAGNGQRIVCRNNNGWRWESA